MADFTNPRSPLSGLCWNADATHWRHTSARVVVRNAIAEGRLGLEDVIIGQRIGSASAVGQAFRATVRSNGIEVAVKITPVAAEIELAQELGEKALDNLDEPYPMVFGSGRKPGLEKEFYIISELAAGDFRQIWNETKAHKANLKQWCDIHLSAHGTWPETVTRRMVMEKLLQQAMYALDALHNRGYVHGDAHFGNFMVLRSGFVVVHDFDKTKPIGTTPLATKENDASSLTAHALDYIKPNGAFHQCMKRWVESKKR